MELGAGFNNIDRSRWFVTRKVFGGSSAGSYDVDSTHRDRSLNYFDGQLALVSDNTLFGNTGPIMGRRYRFQVSPVVGTYNWVQYLADYRRYDPIIFNYLTVATRAYADLSIGRRRDGVPEVHRAAGLRSRIRPEQQLLSELPGRRRQSVELQRRPAARQPRGGRQRRAALPAGPAGGARLPALRSAAARRVVFLRRRTRVVAGPVGVRWRGRSNFDVSTQRYPLRSYGAGLRLNLFNYAILRWDYAVPS